MGMKCGVRADVNVGVDFSVRVETWLLEVKVLLSLQQEEAWLHHHL